jgi:hypothetical protein
MPPINSSSNSKGVTIADIVIVLLLTMAWFFLVQVSSSFVVVAMSGAAWFLVAIYIISKFTGFLSFMKLTTPTWTISYLISLPIWLLLFSILPVNKLPSAVAEGSKYILDQLIPARVMDWMINSLFFAITESLIVVFLFAFFIGLTLNKTQGMGTRNKKGQLAAIIFIASFAAILHTGIALISSASGGYSLTTVLIHQLVAFFVMIIMGFFLGAPGIIAPHMAKDDLVYADVGLWWVSLLICIIIDIYSLIANKKEGNKQLISKIKSSFT